MATIRSMKAGLMSSTGAGELLQTGDALPTSPIIEAVSPNGLRLTREFDVAVYVKGDRKPLDLYDTELLLSYEEVEIAPLGAEASAEATDDVAGRTLAGEGENTFIASDEADLFVLNYGTDPLINGGNIVRGFDVEEDAIGLIGLGVNRTNFDSTLFQQLSGDDLLLHLGSTSTDPLLATLEGVNETLGLENFYLA